MLQVNYSWIFIAFLGDKFHLVVSWSCYETISKTLRHFQQISTVGTVACFENRLFFQDAAFFQKYILVCEIPRNLIHAGFNSLLRKQLGKNGDKNEWTNSELYLNLKTNHTALSWNSEQSCMFLDSFTHSRSPDRYRKWYKKYRKTIYFEYIW